MREPTLYEDIDDFNHWRKGRVLEYMRTKDEQFVIGIRCRKTWSRRRTCLILTNQRLLILERRQGSDTIEDFSLNDIIDVDYRDGLTTKKLVVITSNDSSNEWKVGGDLYPFVRVLRTYAISSIYSGIPPSPEALKLTPTANSDSDNSRTSTKHQPTSQQSSLTNLSPVEFKLQLQNMDEYRFEHFLAGLWSRMDWKTQVLQASGDAGIDVIATKAEPYPQKTIIQAKRYSDGTNVGGPAIQQYASLKHQVPGVDSVIVVTTSSFTKAAKERADELNVKIIDGDTLSTMIESLGAYDLATEYLDTSSVSNSSVKLTSYILMNQLPSDEKNLILWNSGYIDRLYPDNSSSDIVRRVPKYRESELFEWPNKSIVEISSRVGKNIVVRNVETGTTEYTRRPVIEEEMQNGRVKFIGVPKYNKF